jgi:hypothetical protein
VFALFLQTQLLGFLDSSSLNFVPLAIEAKALPLLKKLLAQETEQLPIRAPKSTVISCVKLISDRPLGARSVLADPLLYQAVLDAASRIMSEWCLQQERSTASSHIVTSRTGFDAMVTVANLLNAGAVCLVPILVCIPMNPSCAAS